MLRCPLQCCSCRWSLWEQSSHFGMRSQAGGLMTQHGSANARLVLVEAYGNCVDYRGPPSWLFCAFPWCRDWYHSCFVYCWLGLRVLGKNLSLKALKGGGKEELQGMWLAEHSLIWKRQGRLPSSLLIRWNFPNCVKKWGFQKHLNSDHSSDCGSLST